MSSAQRAASADGNVRDIAYLHKLISNCVALRIERSVLYLRLSGIADDLARADCFSAALSALDWLPMLTFPASTAFPTAISRWCGGSSRKSSFAPPPPS